MAGILNILFVCTARSWGGNEKWSAMAMNALVTRGHQVYLIARKKDIWAGRLNGVSIVGLPFFLNWNPLTYIRTDLLLRRWKIDRVVSTKRPEYFVLGLLSRRRHIRHLIRLGIVRRLDSPYKRWVYGRINEGIIVNATATREVLLQDGIPEDRVALIYNGIPNPPSLRSPRDSKGTILKLVSVGTLHPRKGFHILLRAVSALPGNLKNRVELAIVGEGPALAELEALVKKLKVESRVRFTGFLSDPSAELDSADLFVLLTANEGISNALLEAMVRGIPVLTTDAGGTRDFLVDGHNGFLTSLNHDDVVTRLTEVLVNPKLGEIGRTGRDTVLEFFSLNRMTDQLESFLEGPS